MAKFKGAVLECQICGKWFKVPQCRAETAVTCSRTCRAEYAARSMRKDKVKLRCPVCGKFYFKHESQAVTRRYCSNECRYKSPEYLNKLSEALQGSGNGMWKGGVVSHSDGYLYERAFDHPYASNGYVLQHRLVVERHLRATDPESVYLSDVNGKSYLRPKVVVHHKNFDRKDNRIENLEVLSTGDHQRLHNQLRRNSK